MKNDTTFVRMRSSDHLGDAKMSKRAPHAGKIISKIAHEPAKARVRVAARALRLRVQLQCKAMYASPRSRKKNVAGWHRSLHCGSNGVL